MFNNSDIKKVHDFLQRNRDVTRLEIVGGTGLSPEVVQAVLDAVGSEVTVEGSANTARYNLAGTTAPVVEQPVPEDFQTSEQRWSDDARRRGLEEFARLHPEPKPKPRHIITDADIVIPPAPKPLSKEEREFLEVSMKDRRAVNQNRFIKG